VDSKKKYRRLNTILIVLGILSVLMFAYANVYQPHFAPKEQVTVYVAKEDISAFVDLTRDMFLPVRVDKNSVPKGAVTNINDVVGKHQLSGKLYKGEMLFKNRLAEPADGDGPLIAEIQVPTTIPLRHNDKIRVYVQYVNEEGKVVVEELFHEKRVISRDVLQSGASIGDRAEQFAKDAISPASDGNVIYLRLSDEEVLKYQEAINIGELYVVKIDGEESGEGLSTKKTVSERPAKQQEEVGKVEIGYYEVQEEDTVETIADRFSTSPEVVAELNGGATDFKPGDRIKVPAN